YDTSYLTTSIEKPSCAKGINSSQLEGESSKSKQASVYTRRMMDLRASYDYLPFDEYYKAGKAVELLHWDKNSQFCPACGIKTQRLSAIGKRCDCCKQEFYPQVAPAMIIRIRKGDSILLVRAKSFRGTFRGLVAGFVETGESLEECVHREVLEETGLIIENVKYFGSQPWPYPSVLMIGFTADYKSGELRLQEEELIAGEFFTKENLPELPRKLSLARKLIDAWLEEV
ncbi:MAG: NAD(+) diphosphatase, partial [Phocaeicola sp.]